MNIWALSLWLTIFPAAPPPTAEGVASRAKIQQDGSPAEAELPALPDIEAEEGATTRRGWWERVLAVPADLSSFFDSFHDMVSKQLIDRSDQIDQFFGDERIEDDPRVVLLRFRQEFVWSENGEIDTRTKVKVRIPFRRLERRLRLIIDTDSDEEELLGDDLLDDSETGARTAGVRYALSVTRRSSVSVDVGGKFDNGIKARSELKLQHTWSTEEWRARIFEGVYWRDGEGFGERTRFDIDHAAGKFGLARSRSKAEWAETTRGVELEQIFSLSRALDEKTALSTAIGVEAHTRPSWIVDGYSAEIRLRRQLHRKWLFLEIIPGAGFPRGRRYEFTPQLGLLLEVRFGGELPTYAEGDEPEDLAPTR